MVSPTGFLNCEYRGVEGGRCGAKKFFFPSIKKVRDDRAKSPEALE